MPMALTHPTQHVWIRAPVFAMRLQAFRKKYYGMEVTSCNN